LIATTGIPSWSKDNLSGKCRRGDALSAGGKIEQCGWLKDRYGVSWQITPAIMQKLLADPDPAVAKRVMDAVLQMVKIDIATLEKARDRELVG
jgi:hypothetical protein